MFLFKLAEEEEEVDTNLDGFIDDNPDEADEGNKSSGSESEGEGGSEKRKRRDSIVDEDLDEDEYDLLEENLGIKLQRKVKKNDIRFASFAWKSQ